MTSPLTVNKIPTTMSDTSGAVKITPADPTVTTVTRRVPSSRPVRKHKTEAPEIKKGPEKIRGPLSRYWSDAKRVSPPIRFRYCSLFT